LFQFFKHVKLILSTSKSVTETRTCTLHPGELPKLDKKIRTGRRCPVVLHVWRFVIGIFAVYNGFLPQPGKSSTITTVYERIPSGRSCTNAGIQRCIVGALLTLQLIASLDHNPR
jgi:hypothetical protein